jgi:hypothetical protein
MVRMDGPGSGDCLVVLTFLCFWCCWRDMSIYQSLFLVICMGVGRVEWDRVGFSGLYLLWELHYCNVARYDDEESIIYYLDDIFLCLGTCSYHGKLNVSLRMHVGRLPGCDGGCLSKLHHGTCKTWSKLCFSLVL